MALSDGDNKITMRDLINSAMGGAIFCVGAFLLSGLAEILIRQLLVNLGILGIVAFDSFRIAKTIIVFGIAYLLSGFLGGLFMGYRCGEISNLFPLITASIGFAAFIPPSYFVGWLSLPTAYTDVLIPALVGDFVGTYLGAYTINWPSGEGESSEVGIELDEEALKGQGEDSSSE